MSYGGQVHRKYDPGRILGINAQLSGQAKVNENPTNELAKLGSRSEKLDKHVLVIEQRAKLVTKEMVLLAKSLMTMALYKQVKSSQVENCSFGVSLCPAEIDIDGGMRVTFFATKQDAEKKKRLRRRKSTSESTHKDNYIGSYCISQYFQIEHKDLPADSLKLIPTATALVQAELEQLEKDAIDDIAFIEVFEEDETI